MLQLLTPFIVTILLFFAFYILALVFHIAHEFNAKTYFENGVLVTVPETFNKEISLFFEVNIFNFKKSRDYNTEFFWIVNAIFIIFAELSIADENDWY